MPVYIIFGKYTKEGISKKKESLLRYEAFSNRTGSVRVKSTQYETNRIE